MDQTVIVSYARTPFGKFSGALKSLTAMQLGGIVIKEALSRANTAGEDVDYVYMGHVLQAGCGQNPAKQVAA